MLRRSLFSMFILLRLLGSEAGSINPEGEIGADGRDLSLKLFHSPHPGQRPSHLGSSWPQEEQQKTVLFLDFAIT